MKKFALSLLLAGTAALGMGTLASAATNTAPTVTPSSGGPGFSFTVTVTGCTIEEAITFSFPPKPPNKVVPCASVSPPPPTTAATTTTAAPTTTSTTTSTTTTTTTTTTTVAPTTTDCIAPTLDLVDGIARPAIPLPPCCPVLTSGFARPAGGSNNCDALTESLRAGAVRPAQTTSGGTASATFVAPSAPGTYTGTVTSAAGVQNFSITVTGAATLPATGSDETGMMTVIAIALLVSGGVLFIVAQARRSRPDTV
jgi:LPXTG-motif cell wall-anchored protein